MIKKILLYLVLVLINITLSFAVASDTQQSQSLSLNFQDIKVRNLLQILAEFAHMNIIVSDTVQGSITLHLDNVSWQQALAIILQNQGLGKQQVGNVWMIAPAKELAEREKQQLQAEQDLADLAPLHSELIQINYGKAADMAVLLQENKGGNGLLSERGSVSIDNRTNTLWIEDTQEKLGMVKNFIKQLDIPVKQVLIAARIVNIDSNFEQELGVRFDLVRPPHAASPDVPLTQRLNIDLPMATADAVPGTLALTTLGAGTLLDLELSALESEGKGQVISSPRLLTADQQPAVIESGEEIPYQQETSSGATSVTFKKAVLSLSVTPQITPDGKIMMLLKVNQDRANFDRPVQGVPAIDTRQLNTQVLVNNGQTIVLGGIYETNDSNKIVRVPLLGSLPYVGALFRHHTTINQRSELLIFITPRIVAQTPNSSA